MNKRPPLHCSSYGDFSAGKTHFASTFPTPILACVTDGLGKETAYLKLGACSERYEDELGTPCVDVLGNTKQNKGDLLCRIEYYLDSDPTKPQGTERFSKRMACFQDEIGDWATFVLDSLTSFELTARMREKYKLNPRAKDGRQWYAGAADVIEETVCIRLASLPINVVIISHVDETKDDVHGSVLRTIKAPPRLKKGIPSMYPEVYRAYPTQDEDGSTLYMLQTKSDRLYAAETQIGAPDPCWNDYQSLWENWK